MLQHIVVGLIITITPFTLQLDSPRSAASTHRAKPPVVLVQSLPDSSPSLNVWSAGNTAKAVQFYNEVVLVNTLVDNQKKAEEAARAAALAAEHSYSDPPSLNYPLGGVGSCGGDLPPCYVVNRESGGSYTALNPNGCGSFCYGKYQFSADWGGKLGLPGDITQATPEQQDAAARELWNGGAGCGNWAAC